MSSINEKKYPAAHPVISTKSPEPHALHLASAQAEADNDRAVRLIMASKGLTWPEAQEFVAKKTAAAILAEADRSAAESAPLPQAPRVGALHPEASARLDDLEKRVAKLEAQPSINTSKSDSVQ